MERAIRRKRMPRERARSGSIGEITIQKDDKINKMRIKTLGVTAAGSIILMFNKRDSGSLLDWSLISLELPLVKRGDFAFYEDRSPSAVVNDEMRLKIDDRQFRGCAGGADHQGQRVNEEGGTHRRRAMQERRGGAGELLQEKWSSRSPLGNWTLQHAFRSGSQRGDIQSRRFSSLGHSHSAGYCLIFPFRFA